MLMLGLGFGTSQPAAVGAVEGTLATFYQHHIKPAANFMMSHGLAFGVERWE